MPFLTEADTRVNINGGFTLLSDLHYATSGKSLIIVPKGFETDFASIPRTPLLRALFPVNDRHRRAAILHDYLYSKRGRIVVKTVLGGTELWDLSRKGCDKIFLRAMKDDGVSWWKRTAMYRGVRIGGWVKYPKDKTR